MAKAKNVSSIGATAALAGYEYQLNVSVLIALRLLLISKSATSVTLEPANEEDLEADLAPYRPGRVMPSARVGGGYTLVIQVKRRTGEPWSIKDFIALLEHGEKRVPAKHHLDDAKNHYLLVTSADAKGEARNLLVAGAEESPESHSFPKSLKKILPKDAPGRVAIWGGATEQKIERDIAEVLTEYLRVPRSRQANCLQKLRQEAISRMRGTSPGTWTREDVLAVIRSHGGYLASSAELEAFVPPSNFDQMKAVLQERNAIVIAGPSGSGKTLCALALCDAMRQMDGAVDMVAVGRGDGPESTRPLLDTGPVLFYIEDPWGQYSLVPGADAWTEQLPRLLGGAQPGRRFVVTSRSDMLSQAHAGEGLKKWSVVLGPDHYRDGELANIYEKRMHALPASLQPIALDLRVRALEALESPLELDLFFTSLADDAQPGETASAMFHRLLKSAHRDAVGGVVVRYLSAFESVGSAAVIWAVLAARSEIGRDRLVALQRQLGKADVALAVGVQQMVDRLVATRHLRQPAAAVAFSHPSVREGFELFLKRNWLRSDAALALLISALTDLPDAHRGWGLETAARVVEAVDLLRAGIDEAAGFETTVQSRAAIDTWLENALVDGTSEFPALLALAAKVGTRDSVPSELARWLVNGVRRGGALFVKDWAPPSFDDDWYRCVRADPKSFVIADRFVREQLPQDHNTYGCGFPSKLDRIADGLTPAFLCVAPQLIGIGFDTNVAAVAAGAIRDIAAFESVLAEALDDLTRIEQAFNSEGAERSRAIGDGELDAGFEEHYGTFDSEEGYASRQFVDAYIKAKRAVGDWHSLAHHARAPELAPYWAEEVSRYPQDTSADELTALLELATGVGCEAVAWEAIAQCWDESFGHKLVARILSIPDDRSLGRALVFCACKAAPAILSLCLPELSAAPAAMAGLIVDVRDGSRRLTAEQRISVLDRLPAQAREIADALAGDEADGADAKAKKTAARAVGKTALALLEAAAADCAIDLLEDIVPVIIASGGRPVTAIRRWLQTSERSSAAAAVRAAIAIDDYALVRLGLEHARADARQIAFAYLADAHAGALPEELLRLAGDPGSRVRRAVVVALGQRPHPRHLPVLMKLTRDRWSDLDFYDYDVNSYPIAREAVQALVVYDKLPRKLGADLIDLARATDDRALCAIALWVAAKQCGPRVRRRIRALADDRELRTKRVDAIDALSGVSRLEPDIVASITEAKVRAWPAPLSAAALELASARLPLDDAVDLIERVGHSQSHRALLVLGVVVLEQRDRDAAIRLLALLGAGHPAGRILDPHGERPQRTVLDDLGDVRVRKSVAARLGSRLAKD